MGLERERLRVSWRYRLRELVMVATVLTALGAIGTFAWMTRQPDHPVFERLSEIPLIGMVVDEVRRPFLPPFPNASRTRATHAAATSASATSDPATLEDDPDAEWIGIGAHLYDEPSRNSRRRSRTVRLAQYAVLERRSPWLLIELPDSTAAWVDRSEPRDKAPPLGDAPLPVGPLAARPVDPEQLAAARAVLGPGARELDLVGYSAWLDLDSGSGTDALFRRLRSTIAPLERQFADLYGVVPVGGARETVVIYASASSYEALQSQTSGLVGVASAGHTTGGMVALAVGERETWEVETTLVHEIAHLLSRRAIGPGLPRWLAEGLADHFAVLGRRANPERDERWRVVGEEHIAYRGPLASLRLLAERAEEGTLLSLSQLSSASESRFFDAQEAPLLYAQSAFWVDHLLQDEESAETFRAYLDSVAAGGPATGAELAQRLGQSWDALDREFRRWLIDRRASAIAAGW